MGVSPSSPARTIRLARTLAIVPVVSLILSGVTLESGCGMSTAQTPPKTPPPTQPSYPSVPPVSNTWSPSTSNLPAPAANTTIPPLLTGESDFPLTVSNPQPNATVTSPVNVVASATPKNPIFFMRVYDLNSNDPTNSISDYFTFNNSINAQIFLAPGPHTLLVMAQDKQGYISATPVKITISSQAPSTGGKTVISGIQGMPGWQSCGGLFPPNSGRAGQICAAGGGTPTFSLTQNQATPSLDGNSTKFSISSTGPDTPCAGYCNELSFNPVAGGNNVSHFLYDVYFYIDNPNAAQALEFDTNQTFGGNRWVWGSECNFKADGVWDIWNDAPNTGWEPTNIPCKATDFQPNTWNHLIWDVQRNGNMVQYNTLTINGTVYPVNTTYPYQQDWTLEEIDVAFQMDLDEVGTPYNVWLDKMNLTAY